MLTAVVMMSMTTAVADPVDSLNESDSEFIEEYSALYDSLKDEELKSLLSKIRIKHEIAEKKADIADQQEDIAIKNRNLVFLSIVATVAIIFAAIATFFFIRQLQDSKFYYETDMTCGTAIVMGTESTGLTQQWREAASAHIKIPMLGQLDSLNVSVSAAILMFEAVRQRMQKQ